MPGAAESRVLSDEQIAALCRSLVSDEDSLPPVDEWPAEWGEPTRYEKWIDSPRPFDFTGRSYLDPADVRPLSFGARWLETFITRCELGLDDTRVTLHESHLELLREHDRVCHERVCDERPSVERPGHLPDSNPEIFDGNLIGLLAIGRLLADRDPGFWPRLRKRGCSPRMVRKANRIVNETRRPLASSSSTGLESIPGIVRDHVRATDISPAPVAAPRRPCNRARSSRRRAPGRHQGSRRTSSRSAGGGSSGDDDGESEPGSGLRLRPTRWGSCNPPLIRVLLGAVS